MLPLLLTACLTGANGPNVLLLTVDDMSADSVGAFGCKLAGTTPAIDRLAAQGRRFEFAHVQVGNCMPSRNVLLSGRYPYATGVEGFYQVKKPGYPVLTDLMKRAGYFTAIRGKASHSTPYSPYGWDAILDGELKDPASYGVSTREGIKAAADAGKPFCLVVNVSDPHKPFYSQSQRGRPAAPFKPSRVFTAAEVPVPGFLPDDPAVRQELALYYSTVRRADDAVASVIEALDESGRANNTLVVFLSDHGMPLPFAKTQLYHHSTRTPWIVRWPGVTKPGSADSQHMISAVDLVPTLLDIAGEAHPDGLQGRSFLPLLRGKEQKGRDAVFKVYCENSGGQRRPMRAVQTKEWLYIFNPWSDGERVMRGATMGTATYRRMTKLAESDGEVAARVKLFKHRDPEELYNVTEDPDCRVNLVADRPAKAAELRGRLYEHLKQTGDLMAHLLKPGSTRDDADAYIAKVEKESAERRKPKKRRRRGLIKLDVPATAKPGQPITVRVTHKLTKRLGKQQLHVTIKGGRSQKRLERKVVEVSGRGTAEVTFDVPPEVADGQLWFAAFVGPDFPQSLQHVKAGPIRTVK